MKNIRRFIALTICIVMAAVCFVGCGGSRPSGDGSEPSGTGSNAPSGGGTANSKTEEAKNNLNFNGATITMIFEYQPSDKYGIDPSRDRELDRLAEVQKRFNVVIEQKKGSADYNEAIITSTLSGAPVGHLILINGNKNFNFIKAGVCADVSPAMEKTGITFSSKQYYAENGKYYEVNGSQYVIPVHISQTPIAINFWLFNKQIFEELNLESPYDLMKQNKWTWDKVTELAKLATRRSSDGQITQYGLGMQYAYRTLYALVVVNGGSLGSVNAAGHPQVNMNTDPVREAMNQIYNWGAVDRVAVANDGSLETTAIDKMFSNGEIAILSGNPSSIKRAYNNGMTNFGVVLAPTGPHSNGYKSPVAVGDGFMIPKTYEADADKLLLLLDELYAPYESSYEDLLKEDWMSYFSDAEGYNYFKQGCLDTSIYVRDPFTAYNLEWVEPAFGTVCGNLVHGTVTAGTAIEQYNDQYQALLDDTFDGMLLTGLVD